MELTGRDIGAPYNPPSQDKDIGDTEVQSPTCTAAQLQSDEQKILQEIQKGKERGHKSPEAVDFVCLLPPRLIRSFTEFD